MAEKKRGLGKKLQRSNSNALGAFLDAQQIIEDSHQNIQDVQEQKNEQLLNVPVELIQRGRYQPRRHFDEAGLDELADSIQAQGLMQPIILRPIAETDNSGIRYEIIAGERRWRAVQKASLDTISAIIRTVSDEAAIAMGLIENMQRENLNAMEEAVALQRIQIEFELTHDEIAQAVGKSRSAVSNLIRLTQLPDGVRTLLERGDLEMGHARALLPLKGNMQLEIANRVIEADMSVRQAETFVRSLQQPTKAKSVKAPVVNPDIEPLERELSEVLGTSVTIQTSKGNKGKIIINYANLDVLDGILKRLK